MENLTELIKAEIKRQYGSVKEFSAQTGIPMSTLNSAFPKGIESSSYELVMRVCDILKIKRVYDDEITYLNREYYELVRKMECLDDQGLATVKALLAVESARCSGKPIIQGFNGVGHVKTKDERLKDLIRELIIESKGM